MVAEKKRIVLTIVMIMSIFFSNGYLNTVCPASFLQEQKSSVCVQNLAGEQLSAVSASIRNVAVAEDFSGSTYAKRVSKTTQIYFTSVLAVLFKIAVIPKINSWKIMQGTRTGCFVRHRIICFIHKEDGKKGRYMHSFTA